MGVQIISLEAMRRERRKVSATEQVPFVLNNQVHYVEKNIVNGEMEVLELQKPIGEMITTQSNRTELLEKVVLDVELGRETVPILYSPIYSRTVDPNFPEVFDAQWIAHGNVVFLSHIEGEEVKFGFVSAEEGPIARIVTWAAGFEYTEDMIEYNKTYQIEALNKAMGEAHNALLNHIHFAPILDYNYGDANKTTNQGEATDPYSLQVKKTLAKAIQDTAVAKRPASVLLASGTKRFDIENALKEMTIGGTVYSAIGGIDSIIYYDGWETQVGRKRYAYSGVNKNKAYLIRPKLGFRELVKHELRIDAALADLSRLIESQVVGRTRRGVFAAIEQNVQEVDLTAAVAQQGEA